MPYGSADVEQALDKEIASLRKRNAALKAKVEKFTSTNSRYVAVLEEDYRILNRMGGALEGCRAELALVIEHLNAEK